MYNRREPRLFDPNLTLIMARQAPLYEHEMMPGDILNIVEERGDSPGDVTLDMAIRLWVSGWANYAAGQGGGAEPPQPISPVQIEGGAAGWYMITAPWLPEGERVRGKEAAERRRDEIEAKGDTKGVTVSGGDGGWYQVTAPWLEEPERIQGQDAANERADALIAEGPPDGWRLLTQEEKDAKSAEDAENERVRVAAADEAEAGAEADRLAIEAAAQSTEPVQPGTTLESPPTAAPDVTA